MAKVVDMAGNRVKRGAVDRLFSLLSLPLRFLGFLLAGVVLVFRDGPAYPTEKGHRPRSGREEAQLYVGAAIWAILPATVNLASPFWSKLIPAEFKTFLFVPVAALVVVILAAVAIVVIARRFIYTESTQTRRIVVPHFWQVPALLVPMAIALALPIAAIVLGYGWTALVLATVAGGISYWIALRISLRLAGQKRTKAEEVAAMLRVACGVTDQEVAGNLRFQNGSWTLAPAPAIALAKISADPAGVDATVASVMPGHEVVIEGRTLVVREATSETVARRAALASSDSLIVGIVPDPEDSERKLLTLAPSVSPTAGPRVDAWARAQGLDLVSWRPYEHAAIATAALSADERAHRQRYADALKSEPFDVDVQISATPEGKRLITIRSQAITRLGGTARDAFTDDLIKITPGASDVWLVAMDAVTGAVTITERQDPLSSVFLYPDSATTMHTSVPVGVNEDGDEVRLGLIESNMLIAGIPGSGKSGTSTCLLRGISQLPYTALVGIDPKLVELSLWETRFSMIAMEQESIHATAVLDSLVEEMKRRYRWLRDARLKKITTKQLSNEMPLIVLVIDELADLVASGSTPEEKRAGGERATMVRRLVQLGRAAGIVVITLTQKPSSAVIPTELRDIIAQRVAHATTTPEMTETILAAGARETAPAQNIPPSSKGVGYIRGEASKVAIRFRSYWVPDEQVESLAESTAHLRVDLPWLPTEEEALGGEKREDTFGQRITSAGDDFDLGELTLDDLDLSDFDDAPTTAAPDELPPAPAAFDTPGNTVPTVPQAQPSVIPSNSPSTNIFDDLFD